MTTNVPALRSVCVPHGLRQRADDRRITAVMVALATLFGLMAAVLTATTIVVGSGVARFYSREGAKSSAGARAPLDRPTIAEEPR